MTRLMQILGAAVFGLGKNLYTRVIFAVCFTLSLQSARLNSHRQDLADSVGSVVTGDSEATAVPWDWASDSGADIRVLVFPGSRRPLATKSTLVS